MVVCVVVNWNGWPDTIACLRTLLHQTFQPLHVVVVDNGSTNESVDRIASFLQEEKGSPTECTLLSNPINVGFAGGANAGIREALRLNAEFVWLLNNDTECPPDTLEKLVETSRKGPHTGIVGTVLYYHADPGQVQAWGGGAINRFTGVTTHFLRPVIPGADFYTTFASVLIRAEVLHEIGLLDPSFFMYYDDSDFCLRMAKTRWKIAVASHTAVLHKESASTEGPRDPFMEKTVALSGMHFLRKHSPVPWLSIPVFLLLKLVNRARRGEWQAFHAVWKAGREVRRRTSAETSGTPRR